MASSWALVKNRRARPTSRTCESPSRTTGMIRPVHASRRACPGLIRLAGVEDPGLLQLAGEGVEVDRHHDGGVGAADLRQVLGGDAFDELGERPAHPLRTRPPLHTRARGWLPGAWVRRSPAAYFFSIAACTVGQGEPAVGLAVPVVGHRQPGRLRGLGLFLLQQVGLVGVGQVGCDHLQEPAAEDPQGPGVVLGGGGDQVPLGLDDQVGVQVVGQRLDRADDHPGLLRRAGHRAANASRTRSWVARS